MKKEMGKSLCWQIAKRKLFDNKMQGVFMMTAAVLTTVLFTVAFAAVFGFESSVRMASMENAAWKAHAAVTEVTDEQYERMKNSSAAAKVSSYRHLGFLAEDAHDCVTELCYSEDLMASWMYYELKQGRMPQSENEIAVSAQFLMSRGIQPDEAVGTQMQIKYTVNEALHTGNFIVTGYYEKKASSSETAFISEDFFNQALAQAKDTQILDGVLGVRVVEVMFANTFRMEKKLEQLLTQAGALENKSILNPAFTMGSSMGAGGVFAVFCVAAFILCCGYFIIYNIFYISVMQDTRFYGSLAALGFFASELKQMVRYKTSLLCMAAVPAGLALGYLLSVSVLPQILRTFGTGSVQILPHPLLFVCAAAFSYLTMRISSRKPAKLASQMAPAGARRYVAKDVYEASVLLGKKQKNKTGRSKTGSSAGKRNGKFRAAVSENGQKLYVMAWRNVVRERKKSILICCSFAVCIILTALFYTVSKSTDMELLIKDSVSCDFVVADRQLFNRARPGAAAVDESILSALKQKEGIVNCGGAHVVDMFNVVFGSRVYARYVEILNAAEEEEMYEAGSMYAKVYGLDKFICTKMEVVKGEADWEKFCLGDYVIVTEMIESYAGERFSDNGSCFEPGDTLRLDPSDEKEYTVLAVANIPYDLSARSQFFGSVDIFLPSDEWIRRMQSREYYMYAYDVEDAYEADWESFLSEFTAQNTAVSYASKAAFREQYEGLFGGVLLLGAAVSVILATIGLMNFINVIYSSVYARRRELAVMQSMGMQKKQVYKMLAAEGSYYMLISWLAGVLAGGALSYFVTRALAMRFIHYKWSPVPYLLFGAAGFLLAASIPCLIFHAVDKKEDLLCRLHSV